LLKNTQSVPLYALRRSLPNWSFEENLAELLEKLPEYGVDEVLTVIDAEEFTHGQMPLDWLRAYQQKLFRLKTELEKCGLVYSVNPFITQGMVDRGRDSREAIPGIVMCVGHDGVSSKVCACPLSEAWRAHTRQVWSLYAETRPSVLWVDDDIRSYNHGPVRYGCFCPLHMQKFSERVGRSVTREELVSAMLAPGEPHSWRRLYLDMQSQMMIDLVAMLAKTVHSVSPETCMGLMCSNPSAHCVEGRRWHEFCCAIADGKTLYARPTSSLYAETNPRDIRNTALCVKHTLAVIPPETMAMAEIENYTYTPYTKSAATTFIQMAVSLAFGCHGLTLNLFDHMGSPMERFPGYGQMLKKNKPFLESLAREFQSPGGYRGVQLLHADDSACSKVLPENADYSCLSQDGGGAAVTLDGLGIANVFAPSRVTMVSGQTIRAFPKTKIEEIFRGGVLIDGPGVQTMIELGLGSLCGCKKLRRAGRLDSFGAISAEELFHPKFGGAPRRYQSLFFGIGNMPVFYDFELMPETESVCALTEPDGQRSKGSAAVFENHLGGKVYMLAFDFREVDSGAFFSPLRVGQMHHALEFLSGGEPDLLVSQDGGHMIPVRRDCDGFTLLGAFNLCLDPWTWEKFRFAFKKPVTEVYRLNEEGIWTEVEYESSFDGRCADLLLHQQVDLQFPLILKVT